MIVGSMLAEPALRAHVLHQFSNLTSRAASFNAAPAGSGPDLAFEDCAWLFDSNILNHGLSRQSFAEAAYLFGVVRDLGACRAAEVGRFKGGTTFLLAAAGATVVSIDVQEPCPGSDAELRSALASFGLDDRVTLVLDPRGYAPAADERFDLVFFDVAGSREFVTEQLELWWPAVSVGGSLIARDGAPYPEGDSRAAVTAGNVLAADSFARHADAERLSDTPGTYARFVKRPGTQAAHRRVLETRAAAVPRLAATRHKTGAKKALSR